MLENQSTTHRTHRTHAHAQYICARFITNSDYVGEKSQAQLGPGPEKPLAQLEARLGPERLLSAQAAGTEKLVAGAA
jgi:hypothetical protein